jgi:hypothetical protein
MNHNGTLKYQLMQSRFCLIKIYEVVFGKGSTAPGRPETLLYTTFFKICPQELIHRKGQQTRNVEQNRC